MVTKDLNINVISTEMDLQLFTNNKYYKKVYMALKKARRDYNIPEQCSVACHEDYIVLYDQQKHIIAMIEI